MLVAANGRLDDAEMRKARCRRLREGGTLFDHSAATPDAIPEQERPDAANYKRPRVDTQSLTPPLRALNVPAQHS